jgi:hypothetical protein
LQHDVFRFEIAVENSLVVGRSKRPSDLSDDLGGPIERHSFGRDL